MQMQILSKKESAKLIVLIISQGYNLYKLKYIYHLKK